ncbi:DUF6585 family protein [Glycomyces tritici]|uniref:DUF3137 domain-containing protein n=1 Tax=Glycomyces tritici TaxID=2665176 RepID=A0ABT7YMZ1_9ACTN|nr:DUF6585 family protein [Glycomyces tritici]MDN3240009.1 hypothetical protein [Glycomyces tritici]
MHSNAEQFPHGDLAAQAGLGRWQAQYRPRKAPIALSMGIAGAIYVALAACFIGSDLLANGFLLILFLVITAFFALGFANLAYTKHKSGAGDTLDFFEHGLIVKGPKTLVSIFTWDDARAYQRLFHYPQTGLVTYNYLLVGPEGNAISIGDPKGAAMSAAVNLEANLDRFTLGAAFDAPQEWGPIVQEQITRAQLPKVLAEIDAGRRVEFGGLALDARSLQVDGRAVPWGDLQGVSVNDGVVAFKIAGRFLKARQSVYTIPNFFVFKAAVHSRTGLAWS